MKIKVEIDINISSGEEPEKVLKGYFDSHTSARKVSGFEILEVSESKITDAEFEDVIPSVVNEEEVSEADLLLRASDVVASKTYQELKAFKSKYKLVTEGESKAALEPVIIEFLTKNLDATFDAE